MKKVFIIHGWDGYPEENWFPWLKKELEDKGFEVFVLQMPDADNPRIEKLIPRYLNTASREPCLCHTLALCRIGFLVIIFLFSCALS